MSHKKVKVFVSQKGQRYQIYYLVSGKGTIMHREKDNISVQPINIQYYMDQNESNKMDHVQIVLSSLIYQDTELVQ